LPFVAFLFWADADCYRKLPSTLPHLLPVDNRKKPEISAFFRFFYPLF